MNTNSKEKPFQRKLSVISSYFRELRYSENLSQSEVSSETGLHRNTIFNIENSKNFEILTLFRLCDFYQIPASELLSILDE
jgi:transcriptional regulator with XRE-family HTH domain